MQTPASHTETHSEISFQSSFLREAQARGFIHQCTDLKALDALMCEKSITAYIGFDATATSLQVGNLVGIMLLRLLQKHGHKAVVLLGGGTSKIGDPSGKDAARQIMTDENLQKNIDGIAVAFEKFLDLKDPKSGAIFNNNDWLQSLNYVDFLRDYGRHFSINRMLSFDSVKLRLEREQNLSFLEFNYMIFQAYDFMHLNAHEDVVLQMGGGDQWGNIINGVELTRRTSGKTVYGLTAPLLTTSSGQKMGKTADGAVWLNPDRLAPYDYWQFWRNVDDNDVIRFMKIFTDIPLETIATYASATGAELNDIKKILADHATALAHGDDALPPIHKAIATLFEKGGHDISTLPTTDVKFDDICEKCVEDMFLLAGFCQTKGEARRLIQGNGARFNDTVITDAKMPITMDLFHDNVLKISSGKKKHHILRISA